MRLPGIGATLDLSEKFTLRKRLDELAAANVNSLILSEAQADTVLSLAGQSGLYAMVEIAIDADVFASPVHTLAIIDRIAKAVKDLRGYPSLIGFLIDCPLDHDAIAKLAPHQPHNALDAIVRAIRKTNSRLLIGINRRAEWRAIPFTDEDLVFANLAKTDPVDVGRTICELHEIADARPLIIEVGEELPSQDEVVARAFGFGAAGVVAPAMRRAVSSERQNIRMLSAGELLPFAHLDGSSVPLPGVTPMVSVVVTARDDERGIGRSLESINRLQYPNYEVIVIDDASRDRSAEIAGAAPGVRLMRQSSRAGFGAIRNIAIRAARGQLIALTRADCVVDVDWLVLAVRVLSEGRYDAVGGPVYVAPHEGGIAARVILSLENAGSARAARDRMVQLADRNMLARKSSLIAVGGFNARFIDDGGDRDLSARMLAAGMTLGWCPAGFVWRSGHSTFRELLRQRIRDGRGEAMLAIGSLATIAQSLAHRHYTAAASSEAVASTAPSGAAKGAARTPAAHTSSR
jgi:GT2 family glycosyltransferase